MTSCRQMYEKSLTLKNKFQYISTICPKEPNIKPFASLTTKQTREKQPLKTIHHKAFAHLAKCSPKSASRSQKSAVQQSFVRRAAKVHLLGSKNCSARQRIFFRKAADFVPKVTSSIKGPSFLFFNPIFNKNCIKKCANSSFFIIFAPIIEIKSRIA